MESRGVLVSDMVSRPPRNPVLGPPLDRQICTLDLLRYAAYGSGRFQRLNVDNALSCARRVMIYADRRRSSTLHHPFFQGEPPDLYYLDLTHKACYFNN
jgi:hypothetical protein